MKNQVTLSAIRNIVTEVVNKLVVDKVKNFATKDDLKKLATKDDLKKFATKEEMIQFKGEILKEIEILREDNAVLSSHGDKLESHETRIVNLEKTL